LENNNLLHILLVDDDVVFMEVTKQLLMINKQFAVETASSAYDALRKLAKDSFDVVVSAYDMPGKDGLNLLEELRKSNKNVPFIMFTGKSREEIAIKALNLGANYYLNKHGKPEVVYGKLIHAINSTVRAAKAEVALRDSEEKFRIYVETSPVAILVSDSQGKFEYANEAASNLLGYSVSQFQGMTIPQFAFPEDMPSGMHHFSKPKTFLVHQEIRMRHKTGKAVFVDMNVATLPNGKRIAFCQDVTERRMAEAKLLAFNRSLRTLSRVNQALIRATDSAVFAREVCRIIVRDCGYALAWIGFAEHDKRKSVRVIAYEGLDKDYIDSLKITWADRPGGRGPTGLAIRTGKPQICRNILADPNTKSWRKQAAEKGYISYIALPLTLNGEVVGALTIYSSEPDPFSDEEMALLTELASDFSYGFSTLQLRADKARIEEALQVREHMLSLIYATVPQILLLLSVEAGKRFRFVSVNQAFLDATGLREDQVVGKAVQEVIPEPSLTLVLKKYRQAIRENKSVSWEEVTVYPAGKKYGEVTVAPLFDSNGRCTHLVGNVYDITERKKAEEALHVSEEKFSKAFKQSPSGIVLTRMRDNAQIEVNQAAIDMSGYSREELIGKSPLDLKMWANPDKRTQLINELLDKGFVRNQEAIMRRKDGTLKTQNISADTIEIEGERHILFTFNDITERKEMEKHLRASEKRFRETLDTMIEGCQIISYDWRYVYVNDAVAKHGRTTKEKLLGKTMMETYPGIEKTPFFTKLQRSMRDRVSMRMENEFTFPEGEKGWFELRINPVPEGVFILSIDITERKKLQEKLVANEEKYHSLFYTMAEGVSLNEIIYDKQGKAIDYIVLDVNPAYEVSTGIKREDAIGKRASELYGADNPPYIDIYAKVAESGEPVKFGEFFQLGAKHFSISVFSPAKGKFATMFTDITERLKQDARLKESEQKFGLLFTKNPAAIVLVDERMHIKEVNPAFLTLFGFSAEEAQNAFLPDLVVPDSLKHESEALRKKAKTASVTVETVRKRKDGIELNVTLSIEPLIKQETFTGFIIVYRDITERVQDRETLETALYETEVLNEKLGVVGGLTRHNVRNKLTAIAGQAYLLQKRMNDNANVTAFTEKINSLVEQAEHLLEFSRTYEKMGMEQLRPINAEDCFNGAAAMFPELQKLQVSNELGGLKVTADSLVIQVFYNLIDNSLKHGAKVTKIRTHFTKKNGTTTLIYEDDGIGIAEAAKEKLFTEDPTIKTPTVHGLPLIRKLMNVYGWTITENGEPGKGAKFTIVIPEKTSQKP